jgi:hypothetical protein
MVPIRGEKIALLLLEFIQELTRGEKKDTVS